MTRRPSERTERPTRVLVALDQRLLRSALRALLERQPGIEVIGEAREGLEPIEATRLLRPDVLVVQIPPSHPEGFGAIARLPRGVRAVVLLPRSDPEAEAAARRAGASDVLVEDADPRQLLGAVRRAGGLGPRASAAQGALTDRERQVVALTAEGCTAEEAARRLGIARRTAEAHLANAMRKLGVRNRAELVRWALQSGIFAP